MKITPEENLRVSARNEANGALRAESVRKFTTGNFNVTPGNCNLRASQLKG
jgi:hypothetical protein